MDLRHCLLDVLLAIVSLTLTKSSGSLSQGADYIAGVHFKITTQTVPRPRIAEEHGKRADGCR